MVSTLSQEPQESHRTAGPLVTLKTGCEREEKQPSTKSSN